MSVDRRMWRERFNALPAWTCPTCDEGRLIPVDDKVWIEETGPSKAEHSHEAWEPDWILSRFAGFMRCSACAEIAAISGTSPTDYFEDWDAGKGYVEHRYVVRSIDPAPLPIRLPSETPETVTTSICDAASLLWQSNDAAANKIRQAVEHLLDGLSVSKMDATGKHKLPLHARIVEFQKADAENGDVLLAMKWLGNSGSHTSGLSRDELLDAFDMLELVLVNLFDTSKQELMAKVAKINAAKGPIKSSIP